MHIPFQFDRGWVQVIRTDAYARALLLGLSLLAAVAASASDFDSEYEAKRWEEIETALPPSPKAENLVPIFVSATTDNRFMVDSASLSVGADGVVRYTLVVQSASGARNVSYEGIRCESAERRFYAFGRADGRWSKARANQWVRIQGSTLNRQHAALFSEYFCVGGSPVHDAEAARAALRKGGQANFGTP